MPTIQLDDITRNRHGGNVASTEANKRAENSKSIWHKRILEFARTRQDFTLKEFCRFWDVPLNVVSGRVSETKALGLIVATDEPRREGCTVLTIA